MKRDLDFKLEILRACKRARTQRERAEILEENGIPRSTYLRWLRRWEAGELEDKPPGRPRSELRTVVREEVERGLSRWIGQKKSKKS